MKHENENTSPDLSAFRQTKPALELEKTPHYPVDADSETSPAGIAFRFERWLAHIDK